MLCQKPKCINQRLNNHKYCRKHLKEIELKSELYLKELKKDEKKG